MLRSILDDDALENLYLSHIFLFRRYYDYNIFIKNYYDYFVTIWSNIHKLNI